MKVSRRPDGNIAIHYSHIHLHTIHMQAGDQSVLLGTTINSAMPTKTKLTRNVSSTAQHAVDIQLPSIVTTFIIRPCMLWRSWTAHWFQYDTRTNWWPKISSPQVSTSSQPNAITTSLTFIGCRHQTACCVWIAESSDWVICGKTLERNSAFSLATSASCFSKSFTSCVNLIMPAKNIILS